MIVHTFLATNIDLNLDHKTNSVLESKIYEASINR